jgi:hypothetical protein
LNPTFRVFVIASAGRCREVDEVRHFTDWDVIRSPALYIRPKQVALDQIIVPRSKLSRISVVY